ncbi:Oidioi.mRNA.OKI2018_I69.XSR.g15771.t1.cds [Oikopleura dioica]|uniref:Oidioi.mRNA.OKI2018_I69.XSR.g15771.t1.cds n=1 Tax=Oikopleura dioica TaxID=34765 RepID=A0ABN7SDX2_OIKDI|nr:Oidioi.mRNA.OKI2018_I69.XSR.g15771.t1.cds [Oikopleura dioica]
MNELFCQDLPSVRRRVKEQYLRRHTTNFSKLQEFRNLTIQDARRLSDSDVFQRPEAKAWLEEFGFKKGSFIERKKQSIGSTSSASSSDRWSFEEIDKTVLPLGVGIRSTLDGKHTITHVQPGSPAHLSGMKKNDKILKVNGIHTSELANYQLVKMLSMNCGGMQIHVESDI